ncbi:N-acetylneuraminate synthase family protein [Chloroflexota bacterium]
MKQIKIGSKTIGDGYPTFVIAEMAWSHDGSLEKAKKIFKGAGDADADAISVHITSLENYMVKDYGDTIKGPLSVGKDKGKENIYNYLDRINLKNSEWQELFSYARELGLIICAMPNDIQSIQLCEILNPDCYVIAAACFIEEQHVQEIAEQKKPVILRVGGATLGEIENTINALKGYDIEDILLLHGFQLYPTRMEDTNLRIIPSLKDIFGFPVGIAEHLAGDDSLAMVIPLVALACGATTIEKHLTHDRELKGEDYVSALSPDKFKTFVGQVRDVEKSFGSPAIEPLTEAELRYRMVSRKRAITAKPLKKGTIINSTDITYKRSDSGIYPDEVRSIIGKTTREDIDQDAAITWDKIL